MFKFDREFFVTKIPEPPNEINIYQATGLLTELAGKSEQNSLVARLRIHDPVIRTWALTKLLKSGKDLDLRTISMAIHVAPRSSYLRKILADYFLRSFQFDSFKKIYQIEKEKAAELNAIHQKLLIAKYANRYGEQVTIYEQMYLMTGDHQYVLDAADIAKSRLNWKEAIKPLLRLMFTNGMSLASSAMNLLRMLERESAKKEFSDFASLFKKNSEKGFNLVKVYAYAQEFYWEKEYEKCIDFIQKSNVLTVTDGKTSLFNNLIAKCHEGLNNFQLAAESYQQQNKSLKRENLSLDKFIKDLDFRANLNVGNVPIDENINYFIMTGFPRSGTTLLENVLASHPSVMTCEETSSLLGSVNSAYKLPIKGDPKRENIAMRAVKHRNLYYENMRRNINKKEVKAVIDKTPIISANIKYMEKIFPNKKYIFSIRHPFDVVLSNYKQDYQPNIAMAAFTDIYEACQLYDYVMSNWFEVFPGETDRVHYVKYDDLVNNFETVIRGTLNFLGVPWTDEVTKFAEHSSKRAVRTPSYANVRKGLTIGVQSSWKNFEFLFDDRCKKLLNPWVTRFGY